MTRKKDPSVLYAKARTKETVERIAENEVHVCITKLITALSSTNEYRTQLRHLCYLPGPEGDVFNGDLEYWSVSDWLADRLLEQGENVLKDFLGVCIWGRAADNQGIPADRAILAVTKDTLTD